MSSDNLVTIRSIRQATIEIGYELDMADSEGCMSPATIHIKNAVEHLLAAVNIIVHGPPTHPSDEGGRDG